MRCFVSPIRSSSTLTSAGLRYSLSMNPAGLGGSGDRPLRFLISVPSALSDVHVTVEELVAEGDKVVERRVSATRKSEFNGMKS